MPNIRSQRVDSQGLEIVASDGRTFSITFAEIKVLFDTQTGNLAMKAAKAQTWLKNSIVSTLGAEQIDTTKILVAFRTSDGKITQLEIDS